VAIATNASSLTTSGGYANSLTVSHTVAGSNTLLLVGVHCRSASTDVTGVTYNGVAMTLVGTNENSGVTGVQWYSLVAPAAGANNVVVSLSSYKLFSVLIYSLTGVDQTTPIEASDFSVANLDGYGTGLSTSITTLTNGARIVTLLSTKDDASPFTAGGSATLIASFDDPDPSLGSTAAQYLDVPTAGATAYSLNWTVGTNWRGATLAIKPAASVAADESIANNTRLTALPDGYDDYALLVSGPAYQWFVVSPISDDLVPNDQGPVANDTRHTDIIGYEQWLGLETSPLAFDWWMGDDTVLLSFAASETPDTASIAITAATTATLAVTETADTLASFVSTALAAFDATAFDNVAFFTDSTSRPTLAATESPDTAAFAVTITLNATLAVTESPDTAAFAMNSFLGVTLSVTEATDTAAFALSVTTTLSFAVTEATDTASILAGGSMPLTLSATELPDVASFGVDIRVSTSFAVTEAADTAAFMLSVPLPPLSVALAASEVQDLAFFGSLIYTPVYYVDTELLRVDYERRSFAIPDENRVVMVPTKNPTSSGLDYSTRASAEPRRRV
jgi:hypothetical protein